MFVYIITTHPIEVRNCSRHELLTRFQTNFRTLNIDRLPTNIQELLYFTQSLQMRGLYM